MAYLSWNKQTISDFSPETISSFYNAGYLFTRVDKGIMIQTRSVRIDLHRFELSSENRRILRKTYAYNLLRFDIPFLKYHWYMAKMAKDFYEKKFGKGTFSANKAKELLTEEKKSNFNKVFVYEGENTNDEWGGNWEQNKAHGFVICYENDTMLHYAYPFYGLGTFSRVSSPNTGIGMMTKAIVHAKENGKKYIYLGSFQRPGDVYKLQFSGIEWFDGTQWQTDTETLKNILQQDT